MQPRKTEVRPHVRHRLPGTRIEGSGRNTADPLPGQHRARNPARRRVLLRHPRDHRHRPPPRPPVPASASRLTVPPPTSEAGPTTGRPTPALPWQPKTTKGVTRDATDPHPQADQTDHRLSARPSHPHRPTPPLLTHPCCGGPERRTAREMQSTPRDQFVGRQLVGYVPPAPALRRSASFLPAADPPNANATGTDRGAGQPTIQAMTAWHRATRRPGPLPRSKRCQTIDGLRPLTVPRRTFLERGTREQYSQCGARAIAGADGAVTAGRAVAFNW